MSILEEAAADEDSRPPTTAPSLVGVKSVALETHSGKTTSTMTTTSGVAYATASQPDVVNNMEKTTPSVVSRPEDR